MARRASPINGSFFTRHRYWVIGLSVVLFLPPLSLLFQLTGDHNFCGTWCPRMFFVWRESTSLAQYFAGFLRSYMGVFLVSAALVFSFFYSRYWCSHMCPIGGIMELSGKLVPESFKIDFSGISAPAFRYGYLLVYFGAAALGVGSLCCSYCNFATIPRLFGAAFSSADLSYFLRTAGAINLVLVVLLGTFSRGGRAYCNLICPIGALDSLVNRLGNKTGKRMRIDTFRCNNCGHCKEVCPMWAISIKETASINPYSCIPCGQCKDLCPADAVEYTRIKEKTIRGDVEWTS